MSFENISGTTKFSEYLVEYNGLNKRGFKEWAFYPGMLFRSHEKWWGNRGKREWPHEGLDMCVYRDESGTTRTLDVHTKIPVIYEGKIVRIIDDFIGKTLCVTHNIHDGRGNILLSIYGHIEPGDGMSEGAEIREGAMVALIKDVHKKKEKMLPHVHISIAWIPQSLCYDELDWDTISNARFVVLMNPIDFITSHYTILTPMKIEEYAL